MEKVTVTVDDGLLKQVMELGGHATVEEACEAALRAYLNQIKRQRLIKHFGTVEYYPGYPQDGSVEAGSKKAV